MPKDCENVKKEIINKVLHIANATTSDENRFVVARDVVDRLFIADYFTFEEMVDFIKNELTLLFHLAQKEMEQLIKEYNSKKEFIQDKQKIAQIKEILYTIKPFEVEPLKELHQEEVITISNYLIQHNVIHNKILLNKYIIDELCPYFELEKGEIAEVIREIEENESKGIEEEDI